MYSNPADYYMDVLGVDVNDYQYSKSVILGYCAQFEKSQYNKELDNQIENVKDEMIITPKNFSP